MFVVLVQIAAGVFLVVWGGLCAALIGLAVYNSLLDLGASLFPRWFPKTVFFHRQSDLKKLRKKINRLEKIRFNASMPDCYAEAAKNAIEEILSGGPDFFAKNGITPPRRRRH